MRSEGLVVFSVGAKRNTEHHQTETECSSAKLVARTHVLPTEGDTHEQARSKQGASKAEGFAYTAQVILALRSSAKHRFISVKRPRGHSREDESVGGLMRSEGLVVFSVGAKRNTEHHQTETECSSAKLVARTHVLPTEGDTHEQARSKQGASKADGIADTAQEILALRSSAKHRFISVKRPRGHRREGESVGGLMRSEGLMECNVGAQRNTAHHQTETECSPAKLVART